MPPQRTDLGGTRAHPTDLADQERFQLSAPEYYGLQGRDLRAIDVAGSLANLAQQAKTPGGDLLGWLQKVGQDALRADIGQMTPQHAGQYLGSALNLYTMGMNPFVAGAMEQRAKDVGNIYEQEQMHNAYAGRDNKQLLWRRIMGDPSLRAYLGLD